MRLVYFCQERNVRALVDVKLEPLEDFRRTRKISLSTGQTERHVFITLFNYCEQHEWISGNPAKKAQSTAQSEAEPGGALYASGGSADLGAGPITSNAGRTA